MRIAFGNDHRGTHLRESILEYLEQHDHQVIDVGAPTRTPVDYPDVAARVGRLVASGQADRGILICGTGLGMCIAANKVHGVRAVPCHDDLTAELSRTHNDANVLCLSGDMIGQRLMERILDIWLTTPFQGGRHERRLRKIAELEREAEHLSGGATEQPQSSDDQ